MPGATDYELFDFERIKTVLSGMTLASVRAIVGDGWLGFFEPGEVINPPPEPSKDLRKPTLFCRWQVEYTEDPEMTLDPEGSATRDGYVRLAFRIQIGVPEGRRLQIFKAAREAFAAGSDRNALVFFAESRAIPRPAQAGWPIYELPIRFTGV